MSLKNWNQAIWHGSLPFNDCMILEIFDLPIRCDISNHIFVNCGSYSTG